MSEIPAARRAPNAKQRTISSNDVKFSIAGIGGVGLVPAITAMMVLTVACATAVHAKMTTNWPQCFC